MRARSVLASAVAACRLLKARWPLRQTAVSASPSGRLKDHQVLATSLSLGSAWKSLGQRRQFGKGESRNKWPKS